MAVLIWPEVNEPFPYYQFAVSLSGERFNQVNTVCYRDSAVFSPKWTARSELTADGWAAWLAIPFRELVACSPAAGTAWGVNFGRVGRLPGDSREISALGATREWHNHGAVRTLIFTAAE